MPEQLTICFPIERGPQSLHARILAMSVRRFLPDIVRIVAFKLPNGSPLSTETLSLFEWLGVEVREFLPRLYYRHPETIFKHVDIASSEFTSKFVILLDPKCILLGSFDISDLSNLAGGFSAPSSYRKDFVSDDILNVAWENIVKQKRDPSLSSAEEVGKQFDPSVIIFDTSSQFSDLWKSSTISVYNAQLGQKVKDMAPRVALQMVIRSLQNRFSMAPQGWGLLPHQEKDAILLRYERMSAILTKPRVRDLLIEFEEAAENAGYYLLNELTPGDIRFFQTLK